MQSSFLDKPEIVEAHPIEWYDGIVTGLAKLRGENGWFFVSLIAWAPDRNEKVYALLSAPDAFVEDILAILKSAGQDIDRVKWSAIQELVQRFRSEVTGSARIIKCERLGERASFETDVLIDKQGLRALLGQSVEDAVENPRSMEWFQLIR